MSETPNPFNRNFEAVARPDGKIDIVPIGPDSIISIEEAAEAIEIAVAELMGRLTERAKINTFQTATLVAVSDLIKESFEILANSKE